MNDVLKSLVVADLGGGRVQSIGYESAGDEARKLELSPFRLTPGEAMTALLRQLEGAPRADGRFAIAGGGSVARSRISDGAHARGSRGASLRWLGLKRGFTEPLRAGGSARDRGPG